jgi:hypothetical protein
MCQRWPLPRVSLVLSSGLVSIYMPWFGLAFALSAHYHIRFRLFATLLQLHSSPSKHKWVLFLLTYSCEWHSQSRELDVDDL